MVLATCLLSVGLKDTLSSAAVGLAISNTIQARERAEGAAVCFQEGAGE